MFTRSIPYRDPVTAFAVFAADAHAVLLDSAAAGRYSVIAADPLRVIEAMAKTVAVDGKMISGDAFAILERELGEYMAADESSPVPFAPGAYGYLGYELGGCLEKLPQPKWNPHLVPLMVMGLYAAVAVFDHADKTAWIIGLTQNDSDKLMQRLRSAPEKAQPVDWSQRGAWQNELPRADVEKNIRRTVDYIQAGDIFQANYTQRFTAQRPKDLDDFAVYRRLRQLSASPFAAFLRCGGVSIASASPERFLHLSAEGRVEAHPIKGTRPRGSDAAKDAALKDELKHSAKDHAENLMIVDLMRSDLGRVCKLGTIHVPKLCAVETFASVHHLVSVVTGRMRDNLGAVDLLRATFPGGSITGAPKIRAMEIIHELEPAPRGAYCGCLGWIGFNGAMDMSMIIRTLTLTPDVIIAQAGGGITADSDPSAEYEESMVKIAPLLQAVAGEYT